MSESDSLANRARIATSVFKDIPIIDLSCLSSETYDTRQSLAEDIRKACIDVGFFYVKNHGIPDDVVRGVLEMSKAFFSLPLDSKLKIENRKTPNFKGYSPLLSGNNNPDGAGDLQEGFEFGWEELNEGSDKQKNIITGVMAGANVWPSEIPGFRENVLKYYHFAVNLGKSLFPLFALALSLPETFFDDKTLHSAALMKLLHYPPQSGPIDGRVVGIGAHTDWEGRMCFTILWQEPGIQALQVLNAQKTWINAPPIPGTLVVNIGDQLARWTSRDDYMIGKEVIYLSADDVFKSTVHRAVNRSGIRRYSIPLFFGTDYDLKLEPISSCISPENPPRYDVITAGEYVKSRLQATYAH